ncbi:MAG: ergothioneine biosynthesis protein EgtB [Candidatus Endobugula sp.]|jgi:ergothioneine biosynthesis protein EgtB
MYECTSNISRYLLFLIFISCGKDSMLLEQFKTTRGYTEVLCKPLQTEDYIPQAADFTSPPKWHLAHTTWFFEEMLLSTYLNDYVVFDTDFGFLFNSYYQGIGERAVRTDRGLMTRPTVETVYAYRHHVDRYIAQLLNVAIVGMNEGKRSRINELIRLGIQHEQQHQELLLTDIKYTLSYNPTFPVYDRHSVFDKDKKTLAKADWISIDEGVYFIGHNTDHSDKNFCFDNELGRHKVYLHDYQISTALVTNREFIAFIDAGAYTDFSYWLDEGWSWICAENITHPLYWHNINGVWFDYTLAGLQAIDLDARVCHISYYEANAFAHWKGHRLPTEFEWEIASRHLNWGERWEWTSSAYLPYPGFAISEGVVGEYNGKFMINQMVLRGASSVTSPDHSRHTYRNFFHPHFQWQYTGIRLIK